MELLYYGHLGTLISVLITEVSSIQRSINTLQYYTGTQNDVLITEVSATQRFVIERFHCRIFLQGKVLSPLLRTELHYATAHAPPTKVQKMRFKSHTHVQLRPHTYVCTYM